MQGIPAWESFSPFGSSVCTRWPAAPGGERGTNHLRGRSQPAVPVFHNTSFTTGNRRDVGNLREMSSFRRPLISDRHSRRVLAALAAPFPEALSVGPSGVATRSRRSRSETHSLRSRTLPGMAASRRFPVMATTPTVEISPLLKRACCTSTAGRRPAGAEPSAAPKCRQ